jgi:hypothetical protein
MTITGAIRSSSQAPERPPRRTHRRHWSGWRTLWPLSSVAWSESRLWCSLRWRSRRHDRDTECMELCGKYSRLFRFAVIRQCASVAQPCVDDLHLSRPLCRKFRRGDCASCSSRKNFSESLPVGPLGSVDCVLTHRSHSLMIRSFASCCFIQRQAAVELETFDLREWQP